MGWFFERKAPNTELTYFTHNVYGAIPRFSRISGRTADLQHDGNAFGNDGMHFIYTVSKTAGTNMNWIANSLDHYYPPVLCLDIMLSPTASDDNAQLAYNPYNQFEGLMNNDTHFGMRHSLPGSLGAQATKAKFDTNGPAQFNFHTEIINYHQCLNMTIEEFKSMGVCAFKPVLRRVSGLYFDDEEGPNPYTLAEGEWEWGYTGTCDRYFEGMTIEGPSEMNVEWGGEATIELTWNPGPIWMVEPPQVTGAMHLPITFTWGTNLPDTGNADPFMVDLYKPRGDNFDFQLLDFGGGGGIFINVPTDTLTNSTFINWDNAFTDWNKGSRTNDFLYHTTIDGVWYGDYFAEGNSLPVNTIDELANYLKTPTHGNVTLIDPQTGPIYGWGTRVEDYVASDYFLATPTQTAIAPNTFQFEYLDRFELADITGGFDYFPPDELPYYDGQQYLYVGVEVLDEVGNIQSFDNLYGIEVTDNFEMDNIGSFDTNVYLTANFNHRFNLKYQHNADGGSLDTDKFYIFLWSATGHFAIKTINVNIGIDTGFYDDLLIPFEEDLWVDVPDLDYEPTNDGTTIQRPPDILYHLFEIEMGYKGGVDTEELEEARRVHQNFDGSLFKMGFSIKDEMRGSELASMIARESYCLPTLTNNKLGFKLLKPTYTGEEQYIVPITHSSIINMQVEREPTSKIVTRLKTYYDFNPSTENYIKDLPALTMGGGGYLLPGYDPGYYNLAQIDVNGEPTFDHTQYTKTVELRLIRDQYSALQWSVQHLFDKCQPHNLITVELPLRFCFLELGDVVRFPEGPYKNENILGEDYSRLLVRNGQYILPLFLIYEVEVGDTVKIKGRQLHHNTVDNLLFDGQNYITIDTDSVTWDGITPDTGEAWSDEGYLGPPDIDFEDGGAEFHGTGDMNTDGSLDVLDVVQIVNLVIEPDSVTEEQRLIADVNGDNNVDVLDVVQIITVIING